MNALPKERADVTKRKKKKWPSSTEERLKTDRLIEDTQTGDCQLDDKEICLYFYLF